MRRLLINCMAMLVLGVPADAGVPLESDKDLATVGSWVISTARFSVGCVATLSYGNDLSLSISGETPGDLTLLVTTDPSAFYVALDGSVEEISSIEIALARKRWGEVEPYGYRGTPGIVKRVDEDFIGHFILSKRLKITELGKEKLSIDLDEKQAAMAAFQKCFDDQ